MLTNSDSAEAALVHMRLRRWFEKVVMAEDPYRKPHPRAFAMAIEELGVDPARTAYVGDTISHDVEGAAAAGMRAIWLDRRDDGHPLPPGALRIGTLGELPQLLESL